MKKIESSQTRTINVEAKNDAYMSLPSNRGPIIK